MEDFIKALNIFMEYRKPKFPFHCEHDILYIWDIDPSEVSDSDIKELEELGFDIDDDSEGFISHKYGSC